MSITQLSTVYTFTYTVPDKPYLAHKGEEGKYWMDVDTKRCEVTIMFDNKMPMTADDALEALRGLVEILEEDF